MRVEGFDQLFLLDHSVSINVDLFEDLKEFILILAFIEMRSDIGVNHSFKLVLEVESLQVTNHFALDLVHFLLVLGYIP